MESPVDVRAVQERELPELLALLKAKAAFDGAASSLVADLDTLRAALFSREPLAKALVAASGDAIVGMATYYSTFSSFIAKPCLWLDDLFVHESYRSKGVGRALMEHLCTIAYKTGCGRVDWVVAADNDNGKDFYARLGASIFDSVRLARLDEKAIAAIVLESSNDSFNPKRLRGPA
jgi:GNAT superfamily N-acetyltransferase